MRRVSSMYRNAIPLDPERLEVTYSPDPVSSDVGPVVYKGSLRFEFAGVVINPKTLKPYFIHKFRQHSGVLTVPNTGTKRIIMGNGYLDKYREGTYSAPAKHTKLPRVHTPYGVALIGEGLGTSLYVGMAVVASYLHELVDPEATGVPYSGYGICSGHGASDEAVAWWEGATKRGLAKKEMIRAEEKGSEEYGPSHSERTQLKLDLLSVEDDPNWLTMSRWLADEKDAFADHIEAPGGGRSVRHDIYSFYQMTLRFLGEEKVIKGSIYYADSPLRDSTPEKFMNDALYDNRFFTGERPPGFHRDRFPVREVTDVVFTEMRLGVELRCTWHEKKADVRHEPAYVLKLKTAIAQRLVLDVTPGLGATYGAMLGDNDMHNSILYLNLQDVQEDQVLRYFYALAFQHGASFSEVAQMRNRAEANRRKQLSPKMRKRVEDRQAAPAAHPAIAELEDDMSDYNIWTHPQEELMRSLLTQPLVRENPPTDYAEVAAALYPDYTDFED